MNKLTYRLISLVIVFTLMFGWYDHAAALPPANTGLAASKAYYVSTTGNDSNPGTNAAPFKTFGKAVSVLQAGDTLQVLAGTYHETLTLSKSGTSNAPIVVIGNNAVLDMQDSKPRGISASGNHLHVSGFEVTGAEEFGIYVNGSNIVVENNTLHDNVTKNGVGTCGISTSWGSALKVKDGTENTTIHGNTIYDNCGEGVAVTRGVSVLVENNTVYDNFSVNIYVDNSPFVTIQNNTSYCTGTHLRDGQRPSGIALGEESYPDWGAQLHDINVSGNTISDCRYGISVYESNVAGTLTDVTINNNNIPSGTKRSISLQTLSNQNVLIKNNQIFNSVYVLQSAGVTLDGNVTGESTPSCSSLYNTNCTFLDVPPTHPYFQHIEALYAAGLTAGCNVNPLEFCPDLIMNRAQVAVFTLRGEFGSDYTPPAPPYVFQDNWSQTPWGERWATGMYQRGLTAGCQTTPRLLYCPNTLTTKEQAAVFALRLRYGSTYTPPVATGTLFADMTDTGHWSLRWAEQAYKEDLLPNCGTDSESGKLLFCPNQLVDRALGAYTIAKAKHLVP